MEACPDFETFKRNFEDGKTQLLWHWDVADFETPVSAYLKLTDSKDYSFLLESVEGGAILGRYSAIGLEPDLLWRYQDKEVSTASGREDWQQDNTSPVESLRNTIADSRIDIVGETMPPMSASGMFGFMGYDMIRLVEDIPDDNKDPLNIPEGVFIRPTLMVIFDNVKHMVCVSTPVRLHKGNTDRAAKEVYDEALQKLEEVWKSLLAVSAHYNMDETSLSLPLQIESNVSRDKYHEMVKTAVEYIHAGDIFQVVPSQRFSMAFDLPPFHLYRSLRRLNPSPFLFFWNFKDFSIVGSSPEILVRVRDGEVTIRPIAGTRKRGKSSAEDQELAADLLSDEKERAEHLMLLDLARNDVGKIAEIGSVEVTDSFTIEYYSHVMHIVSNVRGQLRGDLDAIDALFSGFPAGTVSGAPKIRAMEIIDELEPERRSFYAGCVGYLDGNGDIDTAITLRTALVKDGHLYVQAGGGVVADSDPEFEYQESCNKARAVIAAAEEAVQQAQKKRRMAS